MGGTRNHLLRGNYSRAVKGGAARNSSRKGSILPMSDLIDFVPRGLVHCQVSLGLMEEGGAPAEEDCVSLMNQATASARRFAWILKKMLAR